MQFSPRLMLPLMAVHATVCLVQGPLNQWANDLALIDRTERSLARFTTVPPVVSEWLRSKSR